MVIGTLRRVILLYFSVSSLAILFAPTYQSLERSLVSGDTFSKTNSRLSASLSMRSSTISLSPRLDASCSVIILYPRTISAVFASNLGLSRMSLASKRSMFSIGSSTAFGPLGTFWLILNSFTLLTLGTFTDMLRLDCLTELGSVEPAGSTAVSLNIAATRPYWLFK